MRGWLFDRFELHEALGGGTFATVHRARDHELRGTVFVAVKILRPERREDGDTLDRFIAEARALMQLSHPNVVRAYDLRIDDDDALYAMDLIQGPSLAAVLEDCFAQGRTLPHERAVSLLRGVAAGLDAVHTKGLVHRDLKPSNILVASRNGQEAPRLIDFGLARRVEQSGDQTTVGRFLGSYAYASPEHVAAKPFGPESDRFALATVAFELLTLHRAWIQDASGRPAPLGASPPDATASRVLRAIVAPVRPRISQLRPELEHLDGLFAGAWSLDPAERPRTATEFVDQLEQHLATTQVSPGPGFETTRVTEAGTTPLPVGRLLVDFPAPVFPASGPHTSATTPPRGSPVPGWVTATVSLLAVGALGIAVGMQLGGRSDPIPAPVVLPGEAIEPRAQVPESTPSHLAATPAPTQSRVAAGSGPVVPAVSGAPSVAPSPPAQVPRKRAGVEPPPPRPEPAPTAVQGRSSPLATAWRAVSELSSTGEIDATYELVRAAVDAVEEPRRSELRKILTNARAGNTDPAAVARELRRVLEAIEAR